MVPKVSAVGVEEEAEVLVQDTLSRPALYRCFIYHHLLYKCWCVVNKVTVILIVKLRQGSGKDWQGMAVKEKGLKALSLAKSLH